MAKAQMRYAVVEGTGGRRDASEPRALFAADHRLMAIKLPPEIYDEALRYAEVHYIEVVDAFRYLIEAGLSAEARAMAAN